MTKGMTNFNFSKPQGLLSFSARGRRSDVSEVPLMNTKAVRADSDASVMSLITDRNCCYSDLA